jgi:hypothetical protein
MPTFGVLGMTLTVKGISACFRSNSILEVGSFLVYRVLTLLDNEP